MGLGKLEIEAMISVKIMSGLGNQLFQYASAYALAKKLNTSLTLDISHYLGSKDFRKFELGKLNLHFASFTKKTAFKSFITEISKSKKIRNWLNLYSMPSYFIEEDYGHNDSFMRLRNNTYLDGYFQSVYYFEHNKADLKEQFKCIAPSSYILEWKNRCMDCNSVAIHIRRTDYMDNSFYYQIPNTYYDHALQIIEKKIDNPQFLIFSDDYAWLKKNKYAFPINAILMETRDAVTDFEVMKSCKHFIIANSTFSWWAAWLGDYHEKIVVAPRQWSNAHPNLDRSLLLEDWIKI